MPLNEEQACRLALGDRPAARIQPYRDGWVIWEAGSHLDFGGGATIVDRNGNVSSALSFELANLLGAVARHHRITEEQARESYPELAPPPAPEDDGVPSWAT